MSETPWSLDRTRFQREVLRPVSRGWDPTSNLFRTYLLPPRVADTASIEAAIGGVLAAINQQENSGAYGVAAKVVKRGHQKAAALLRDDVLRSGHRDAVLAARRPLRTALEHDLRDLPAAPPALVDSLVSRFGHAFTGTEVREVVTELGRVVREPARLGEDLEPPADYHKARAELALLDTRSLRAYLLDRFTVLAPSDRQLEDRRLELRRAVNDEALTAEQRVLAKVRTWTRDGQLAGLLAAELRAELLTQAPFGFDAVRRAAADPPVAAALAAWGMPTAADDVAYAAMCLARFPASAGSSWRAAVERAVAARDPRTAVSLLDAQTRLQPAEEKQRDRLRAQIADVNARLEQARELEATDPEGALAEYQRIARISAEPEIDQAMRRCRPAPPGSVTVRARGEGAVIRWTPSTARTGAITYRVLRVPGEVHGSRGQVRPDTDAAVEIALDVDGGEYLDADPPAGQPLFYSVFTLREGQPSHTPATSAEPVVLLPDARDVVLRGGADFVAGSWRLPRGASGARVLRSRPGAATTPVATEPTGFRDRAVEPDVPYTYRIQALYRNHAGGELAGGELASGELASGGVEATAGTRVQPRPVEDLVAGAEAGALTITWTPPPRGTVEVRQFDSTPELRTGAVLPVLSVQDAGTRVVTTAPATDGELHAPVPASGRQYWLVPLTVLDGLAAVGTPHRVDTRLPPVRGLRAQRLGGESVRLTWQWPGEAPEVLVGWKRGAAPSGPGDPDASFRRYTRATYQQDGVDLRLPPGSHTFLVCATARVRGREVYGSPAVAQEGVRRRISYDVRRTGGRWGGRGGGLRLVVESLDGAPPPDVVLVAGSRLPPLDAADGESVLTLASPADQATTRVEAGFTLDALRHLARPLKLRVFPASRSSGAVELIPANPGNLEIR
ncbi:hypothetical protein [Frankia sp. AgKG'84/4]|uniref:hypothetical protein n=1 Tax=Frankia sp. AgKG'84/4 TaxID=573490 RepID=UPI0020108FA0|nr:hypothetical protein [Frankia sp. AgKG'84/4]MCL9793078.1 hypothetical protein [Frankia sp. AgKG'84/4]